METNELSTMFDEFGSKFLDAYSKNETSLTELATILTTKYAEDIITKINGLQNDIESRRYQWIKTMIDELWPQIKAQYVNTLERFSDIQQYFFPDKQSFARMLRQMKMWRTPVGDVL